MIQHRGSSRRRSDASLPIDIKVLEECSKLGVVWHGARNEDAQDRE
jgi:hypothetical protein